MEMIFSAGRPPELSHSFFKSKIFPNELVLQTYISYEVRPVTLSDEWMVFAFRLKGFTVTQLLTFLITI